MQSAERPRKYFRREPGTAAAKALIGSVQAAVREWHGGSAAPTLRVAEGCRPAERAWAYQALEELQLGDEGSPGFYVEKVGDGPVRLPGSDPAPRRSDSGLTAVRPRAFVAVPVVFVWLSGNGQRGRQAARAAAA